MRSYDYDFIRIEGFIVSLTPYPSNKPYAPTSIGLLEDPIVSSKISRPLQTIQALRDNGTNCENKSKTANVDFVDLARLMKSYEIMLHSGRDRTSGNMDTARKEV
ncbi:hypothetical protein WN943_019001 [Citrus x changshan-huyou]